MQQAAETLDKPADLAGIREAAPHLGVSASTISRQVAAGIITNHGTTLRPLVSIEGAKAERAAYLDPAQQREREPKARAAAEPTAFNSARTTHEATKAQLAQLELAERLGQTVAKAEAEDLFATLGGLIRDRLAQRWAVLSADLAGRSAFEIATAGAAADEALLNELVREIETQFGLAPAVADAR